MTKSSKVLFLGQDKIFSALDAWRYTRSKAGARRLPPPQTLLYYSTMPAFATSAVAPLAFATRVRVAKLNSRRRTVRCVAGNSRVLVTTGVMKVDKSLNEVNDDEGAHEEKPRSVLFAAAAVATAIVLAASPARGATTSEMDAFAKPKVDTGAHEYYLDTMEAKGSKPASMLYDDRSSVLYDTATATTDSPTGLDRFGSTATSADETASVVSTAVAVGLFAVLGANSSGGGGGGAGKGKGGSAATKPTIKSKNKPLKTTTVSKTFAAKKRSCTAYVPSYKGEQTSPNYAAAALGATVVMGGLAAGSGGVAVLEAESVSVAAAATGAVLLGTAVSTGNKKTSTVKFNIVSYGRPVTAPAPATKTKPSLQPKPPRKPPTLINTKKTKSDDGGFEKNSSIVTGLLAVSQSERWLSGLPQAHRRR